MNIAPIFLIAALISTTLIVVFLFTEKWHGRFSYDVRNGKQKLHKEKTSRIGGVAIYLAIWLCLPFAGENFEPLYIICISSLPLFVIGLSDDISHGVHWVVKLLLIFASAVFYQTSTGLIVENVTSPIIEYFFIWPPLAFFITSLAITGISNAINIIDGLNGLTAGSLIIMFGGVALMAAKLGDGLLIYLSILHICAILGFFIFNFPWGKIFLGDAGAYYLGFVLAICVILLFERNPSVSQWTASLILVYPLVETLYSIYRKALRKGGNPSKADRRHLHQLIHRVWGQPFAKRNDIENANSVSGAVMWIFPFVSGGLAQIGFSKPHLSPYFFFLCIFAYILIYLRISFIVRGGLLKQRKLD